MKIPGMRISDVETKIVAVNIVVAINTVGKMVYAKKHMANIEHVQEVNFPVVHAAWETAVKQCLPQ